MTVRLEQRDSYQTRFESVVTSVTTRDGARWVALAESCFYPASGGQPADHGLLEGEGGRWRVVDVQRSEGAVWHRLEGEAELTALQRVRGEIDWPRRYRHMQRHSGQHLLSQAFVRLDPAFETCAVSLTGAVCTLDLAGQPDEGALDAAEALVNEVAYQNLPIRAFEVDERELPRYPLRRAPKVSGRVRLVEMGEWERSACGGTHLRGTAEALPIKVLGLSRIKRGLTRVSFRCGAEALEDYRDKHRITLELTRALSVPLAALPARLAALQAKLQASERRLHRAHERLADAEAARLLAAAERVGPHRVVCAALQSEAANEPQRLAAAISREPNAIALLGWTQSAQANLLFMRGARAAADMNWLLQEALPLIAGRGGGNAERAQGGGARSAGLGAALERARALLRAELTS